MNSKGLDNEFDWFPRMFEGFGKEFDWFGGKNQQDLAMNLSYVRDLVRNCIDQKWILKDFGKHSADFLAMLTNLTKINWIANEFWRIWTNSNLIDFRKNS